MEIGVFPKKPLVSTYLQSILLAPVALFIRWMRRLSGSSAVLEEG
jgi:hypothetical protein